MQADIVALDGDPLKDITADAACRICHEGRDCVQERPSRPSLSCKLIGMLLKPAVEADYPEIIDLVNIAFRRTGPSASWNVEGGVIEGQRLNDSLLREDLANNPAAHLLIHRDVADAALLGTVWLDPSDDGIWYLGLLSVRPDLQNRQLGRTLLAAAEQFALERGARQIRMTVLHVRNTLIAWYQRRGYMLTGETKPFPYDDQRFGRPLRDDLHFVVLQKDLVRQT
jgi:ribosomal protein S18 acetylase RimI-like enzyme